MSPLFVLGMLGLGDDIFQRAVIRELSAQRSIYLQTSWPQLYEDLPVRCVKPNTRLRTQAKNAARYPGKWFMPPAHTARARISYGHNTIAGGIVNAMERCVGLRDAKLFWDLPKRPPLDWLGEAAKGKPIALLRPVTIRTEWRNEARNPDPYALREISEALADDYFILSVADLNLRHEWMVQPEPFSHMQCHAGELSFDELLSAIQQAALMVGGVGWIVPAAVASGVPAFVLLGGMGAHNAPDVLLDRRMQTAHIGWAWPDRFCGCASMRHQCEKGISDAKGQFDRWRNLRRV